MGSTAKRVDSKILGKKYSNDSDEDDTEFSPEQEKRFSDFYTDLRNDIQDAHLYGHSFEVWKEMRAKPSEEFLKEIEDIRKSQMKRDQHSGL